MGGDGGGDGDGQVRRVALDRVIQQLRVAVDEAGVELAAAELRVAQDFLVVGRGGLHALHAHVVEGSQAAIQGFFPGQRPDDQLQAHRVVVRRNAVAGVDRRVGAYAGAAGGVVAGDLAEAGQEVVLRVFGIDAELQGIATVDDVALLYRQRQAAGDADLLADDVQPGDFLGDGVFHLHPGIHLHEVHLAVGEQELHGTGILVAHRLRGTYRQVADVGALLGGELRAGGDLDELLVAPLDRTVALEQVHGVAETIGEHLRLDVLGIDDALLEEHLGAAEGLGGLGDHPRIGRFQLAARVAAADATAAAATGGLEHHRVADALGLAQRLAEVGDVAFGARGDRHAGLDHAASRLGLVAHATDHLGAGADELDPAFGTDFRQFGVFREKAIAGMQRITAGFHGQVDQLAWVQVAGQRVVTQAVGFVGALDVQGMAVGFGIDGNRADTHLGTGTHDAHGNLATVGTEDFLQQGAGSFGCGAAQAVVRQASRRL